MADQETPKQLDDLLDSLLSQYSDVEPRPGLETRILARIAESRYATIPPLSRLNWRWTAVASAVLAAIVVFLFYSKPVKQGPPQVKRVQLSPQKLTSAPQGPISDRHAPPSGTVVRRRPPASIRQVAAVEAKREVFPSPEPLSDQERLLFRYLSRTPKRELLAQSHPDPPPREESVEDVHGLFPDVTNQMFSNR